MNPELAKLLSQGQTAPPSVAGTPMANAIRKMMGSGGSAPAQQQAPIGNQPPSQYNTGNQMLQDRSTAGQSAAEQSMRNGEADPAAAGSGQNVPMSTEEELEMARKNMGVGRHQERAQSTDNDLQARLTRQRQH